MMQTAPQLAVSQFCDRSPKKSDEGSTGDDSDPQDLTVGSQPTDEEMAPAPWTIPQPSLAQDFDPEQAMHPSYVSFEGMHTEDSQRQMATEWLQNEMTDLVEMMRLRQAEMCLGQLDSWVHQLEWQLSALNGVNQMPQNPLATPALDAQIFSLHTQLNQLMGSLRTKSLETQQPVVKQPVKAKGAPKVQEEKSDEDDVFTVMMRNIPNKYTQRMLIDEVNEAGFDGAYDFLYLPIDKESGANKGYAFLNFIRPDLAYAFKLAYDGKQMAQFKSNKIVSVAPATIQGFDANYEHFSRTRVNYGDMESRPLFLKTKKGKSKNPHHLPANLKNSRQQAVEMACPTSVLPGTLSPMNVTSPTAVMVMQEVQAQVSFCPFCGMKRGPGWIYCQGCGMKLVN